MQAPRYVVIFSNFPDITTHIPERYAKVQQIESFSLADREKLLYNIFRKTFFFDLSHLKGGICNGQKY
jgi:hypothetical protein